MEAGNNHSTGMSHGIRQCSACCRTAPKPEQTSTRAVKWGLLLVLLGRILQSPLIRRGVLNLKHALKQTHF